MGFVAKIEIVCFLKMSNFEKPAPRITYVYMLCKAPDSIFGNIYMKVGLITHQYSENIGPIDGGKFCLNY